MPKKTLALISGLVLVTVVLFVIALKSSQLSVPSSTPKPVATPTPSMAHSVLTLTPNPLTILPGTIGKVDVNIDTSVNSVTGVQLEISYDPNVLKNVKVVPGQLFQNPLVHTNENDITSGRYTYAIVKLPNQTPVKGTGIVATITFTASSTLGKSQLTLLPSSLLTQIGVADSVLKTSSGTEIIVESNGAVSPSVQASPAAGL